MTAPQRSARDILELHRAARRWAVETAAAYGPGVTVVAVVLMDRQSLAYMADDDGTVTPQYWPTPKRETA